MIENYKKLFLATLRSEFWLWWAENRAIDTLLGKDRNKNLNYTPIPDSSKNEAADTGEEKEILNSPTKDLLKAILKDGKINGKDLENLNNLEKNFDTEKSEALQSTKENLKKSLEEMLEDWFTVKNENDFSVFTKVMKLAGKESMKLATYDEVKKVSQEEEKEDIFTLQLHGDEVKVYSDIGAFWSTDIVWVIQSDGTMRDVGFWEEFLWEDNKNGNNEVELDINWEALDKGYTKYKEKSEILNARSLELQENIVQFIDETLPTLFIIPDIDTQYGEFLVKFSKLNLQLKTLWLKELDIKNFDIQVNKRKDSIKKDIELQGKLKKSLEGDMKNIDFSQINTVENLDKSLYPYKQKIANLNTQLKLFWLSELATIELMKKYNDQIVVIKDRVAEKEKLEENRALEKQKFNTAKDFYKNQVKATPKQIEAIQKALLEAWETLPTYWADKDFWQETYNALLSYQRKNDLFPDGQAGDKTLEKLLATTAKEFYKWEKIKENEAPKNIIENLNIKELGGLKKELKNKTLALVDGEYFFIPKGEIGNTDTFKKALAWEKGEKSLSLEEVLRKIQKTPGIELAIDGWLFNGQLNEAEKLTLVLSALDRKDEKVLDVNTGEYQKEAVKENKFPILDIPSSDFKEGVYNKAAFEKNLIKALNKVIPNTPKEKWVDLTKEQQKALTKAVNTILKERSIPVGIIQASDIITKNTFFGFGNKAKISDLIKDKNIFENLQVADTIVMKGWLFTNVPTIDPKKLYKVINRDEAVVLSGVKLQELFDENKTYEDATLDSDERDFKYSKKEKVKTSIKKEQKEEEDKKKIWTYTDIDGTQKDIILFQYEDQGEDEDEISYSYEIELDGSDKLIDLKKGFDHKPTKAELKKTIVELKKEYENYKNEKLIKNQKFSVKDLLGKQYDDVNVAEYKWLEKFSTGDLNDNAISLNNLEIDMEKWEVQFDFNDKGFNQSENSNLLVKINPEKFSLKNFRSAVAEQAKKAVKNKNKETDKQEK